MNSNKCRKINLNNKKKIAKLFALLKYREHKFNATVGDARKMRALLGICRKE